MGEQLVEFEQLIGEEVLNVINKTANGRGFPLLLLFESGNYAQITIDRGYESCDDDLVMDEGIDKQDLVKLGVISQEEWVKIQEARIAAAAADDEKRKVDRLNQEFAHFNLLKSRLIKNGKLQEVDGVLVEKLNG